MSNKSNMFGSELQCNAGVFDFIVVKKGTLYTSRSPRAIQSWACTVALEWKIGQYLSYLLLKRYLNYFFKCYETSYKIFSLFWHPFSSQLNGRYILFRSAFVNFVRILFYLFILLCCSYFIHTYIAHSFIPEGVAEDLRCSSGMPSSILFAINPIESILSSYFEVYNLSCGV
jgi:hypothetical protein